MSVKDVKQFFVQKVRKNQQYLLRKAKRSLLSLKLKRQNRQQFFMLMLKNKKELKKLKDRQKPSVQYKKLLQKV